MVGEAVPACGWSSLAGCGHAHSRFIWRAQPAPQDPPGPVLEGGEVHGGCALPSSVCPPHPSSFTRLVTGASGRRLLLTVPSELPCPEPMLSSTAHTVAPPPMPDPQHSGPSSAPGRPVQAVSGRRDPCPSSLPRVEEVENRNRFYSETSLSLKEHAFEKAVRSIRRKFIIRACSHGQRQRLGSKAGVPSPRRDRDGPRQGAGGVSERATPWPARVRQPRQLCPLHAHGCF